MQKRILRENDRHDGITHEQEKEEHSVSTHSLIQDKAPFHPIIFEGHDVAVAIVVVAKIE